MIHQLEISLQLSFGRKRILSDVYISCRTGSVTGLLGRNGQGKSCLMQVALGSLKAQDNGVRINNHKVTKGQIVYLPQNGFIPPQLSVANVCRDYALSFDGLVAWFPIFSPLRTTSIRHLSGGERRLLEVYICICADAPFILLDEPFSYLMPLHVERVKELLLQEKAHKGFLITDHQYLQVLNVCDNCYLLQNGKTWPVKSRQDLEQHGYLLPGGG